LYGMSGRALMLALQGSAGSCGHPGGVGQREIALIGQRFGGGNSQLARLR